MGIKQSNKKKLIGFLLIIGIGAMAFFIFHGLSGIPEDDVVVDKDATFALISREDGEDVSNFVEISIWIPKEDIDFDDAEDWFKKANFEEEISSKDADDVEIDLEEYEKIWVEIDPDGETVFETTWYLVDGGKNSNAEYSFDVYHLSSDVHLSTSSRAGSEGWNGVLDGNYSVIMDFPGYTTTNTHVGDNWACDDDDWDDLDADDKLDYYDERNWRNQAPEYILDDDTNNEYSDNMEQLTEAYALKFAFNSTISSTNGNDYQVTSF